MRTYKWDTQMPDERILTSTLICIFSRFLTSEHNTTWWNIIVWGRVKILDTILFLEGKQGHRRE